MKLKNKNIILGITGSIAAYKAAMLTRLLIKEGAQVKIIITPYGKEFITPVTLATLSKNTVLCDFFHHDDGSWNSHVELGIWADLFLVAPVSANTLAKMAYGICDNLLLTTYLSARCPVMFAPAMDFDMFAHPATKHNIEILKQRGNLFVEPSEGELASGLHGKGRMEEPEKIVEEVVAFFKNKESLSGKTFLVTAGPTYEPIDPVRFIGNHSTGKMGYAIAEELAAKGAKVELVSGPVQIKACHANIKVIKVTTAKEMFEHCSAIFSKTNGAILTAAVADFSPQKAETKKIKKENASLAINLVPTVDIAAELGKSKKKNQILVGFALETDNEKTNAEKKMKTKNLDFIVLNSLRDANAGFGFDTNKISIFYKNNKSEKFELKSKHACAVDIVERIIKHIPKK